ncbi:MAG: VOC family protein [Jiangellaceae bacterium]|nr:VOC family protein [Jiangellaceae bacterium]
MPAAPGTPIWIDVGSSDVEATKAFYTQLFGWTASVSPEPEARGYTLFSKEGKTVAAVGPLFNEAQPPAWNTYLASEDVEEDAAEVEHEGGQVLVPPMDVLSHGRMAVFTDPTGAAISVWQAGGMEGAELTRVPGSLTWNELATRDVTVAKEFYSTVFNLTARDIEGPTPYTVLQVGEQAVAGMYPLDDTVPDDVPSYWTCYFEVEDCDAAVATAQQLGATVQVPATDTPAGRYAMITDPQGATFGVIRSNPDYAP